MRIGTNTLVPLYFLAFPAVILSSFPAFAGDEHFNGRWDIQVRNEARHRVWWLEVQGAGASHPKGKFVGAPGGGLDEILDLAIRKGELRFSFERTYYNGPEDKGRRRRGVWTARLVGGKLEGTFGFADQPKPTTTWVGVRAPVIKDRDDGSWRQGRPVVLFDGKDLSQWEFVVAGQPLGWTVQDGIMVNEPHANNLQSKQKFWNFLAHLEYRLRENSNSGVGLRAHYEVQIQDDYGKPVDVHTHGALYSRIAPMENASRPPGEWQTLDIRLVGSVVTVILNGKKVIDKGVIEGLTAIATDADEGKSGPLVIQGDHMPVEFRSIVVTPLTK